MLAVSDSFQLSYESSLHVTWSVVARGLRCADHRDNAATTGPEEAGTDWEPYRFGHSHGPLAFLRQVLSLLCFWLDGSLEDLCTASTPPSMLVLETPNQKELHNTLQVVVSTPERESSHLSLSLPLHPEGLAAPSSHAL